MNNKIIDFELGASTSDNFSEVYADINKGINQNGKLIPSRNGDTREFLDWKTTIGNPYKRCVGLNNRDVNIFFLLAEAIWIFCGNKDVAFLNIFNERMVDYSDDGEFFHAPYGWRLRHYGQSSFPTDHGDIDPSRSNIDQIAVCLRMLEANPEDRRVVAGIWNPELDLATKSKDLPCNDLLMFKIRDDKLNITIENRSNDLHWGLVTNVFQFSFIAEMMSLCLGRELGQQVHNSNSLHIYTSNPINEILLRNETSSGLNNGLYSICEAKKIDFNFENETAILRLKEIDVCLNMIIKNLTMAFESNEISEQDLTYIKLKSPYLHYVFGLLYQYILYKNAPKIDLSRITASKAILSQTPKEYQNLDIFTLALNFFIKRIKDIETKEAILSELTTEVLDNPNLSKLLHKYIGNL